MSSVIARDRERHMATRRSLFFSQIAEEKGASGRGQGGQGLCNGSSLYNQWIICYDPLSYLSTPARP